MWLRPLDAEERAASRVKYPRPSLRLDWKHEVKEARAVKEKAGMQKIWNDLSQATEAKELHRAKAAKRLKAMICTNPDMYSPRKKHNGQSRKKQEWTEYTLTRSYSPSQRARRERERTKQGVALWN